MNENNFDFNIDNYDIIDLQNFLKLGNNYNNNDVNTSIMNFKTKILDYNDSLFYKKFIIFLNKVEQKMLSNLVVEDMMLSNQTNPSKNIITHPNKQFNYTDQSQYYSGTLNPLNTRIIHKYISIDSKFRENYTTTSSNDFYICLPSKIRGVVSMQVTSFEIPITFYGISNSIGNNYFTISITDFSDNIITKEMIIKEGNYSPYSIINYLNENIANRDENGDLIDPNDIFQYIQFQVEIYSDGTGTGKCVIKSDITKIKNIKLNFAFKQNCGRTNTHPASRFGHILGFIKDIYDSNINYISESVMDVFPYKYIYLAIDDFNNNFSYLFLPVYKEATTFSSTIIAKIPVNSEYFTILNENNLKIITDERQYFGPVAIDRLRITLLDEYGNILNTNNSNYSFCILIKKIYDL